jgi:hypothetical protein
VIRPASFQKEMSMTTTEHDELDVREQVAHIDQMLADNRRIASDIRRIDRRRAIRGRCRLHEGLAVR